MDQQQGDRKLKSSAINQAAIYSLATIAANASAWPVRSTSAGAGPRRHLSSAVPHCLQCKLQ